MMIHDLTTCKENTLMLEHFGYFVLRGTSYPTRIKRTTENVTLNVINAKHSHREH